MTPVDQLAPGDRHTAREPGLPCPYLRATTNPANAERLGGPVLPYGIAPLRTVYANARALGFGRLRCASFVVIAGTAASLRPRVVWDNFRYGRTDTRQFTTGPYHRTGHGTQILDHLGEGSFSQVMFDRFFTDHARPFSPTDGGAAELGIDRAGLWAACRAKAAEIGRGFSFALVLLGQFTTLIHAIGRTDVDGARYLRIADMLALYRDLVLPPR